MKIVILDAQGGGMGRQLVEGLKKALPNQPLIAVGTNALATAAMLRAGADQVATGENAVVVCAGMADLILCPIGMVLCDAMLGEVTANMALAVGRSKAHKILLPVSRCQASVAGAPKMSMAEVVAKAVEETVARVSAASVWSELTFLLRRDFASAEATMGLCARPLDPFAAHTSTLGCYR